MHSTQLQTAIATTAIDAARSASFPSLMTLIPTGRNAWSPAMINDYIAPTLIFRTWCEHANRWICIDPGKGTLEYWEAAAKQIASDERRQWESLDTVFWGHFDGRELRVEVR